MSLDPSPLSPTPTPLLSPTDPVPGRGAAALGAGISLVLAILVAFVSLRFGTQLLYLPQGIKAHATAWTVTRPFQIQGFNYQWAKSYSSGSNPNVGYGATTTNQKIFTSEATDSHMNLVVIAVTADQANANTASLTFGQTTPDGYSDDVYKSAAKAATSAGLTPVFKLVVRVNGAKDPSPIDIGSQWSQSDHTTVGTEQNWFNEYTAFATYYARLAQSLNMPFLIIGDDLTRVTVDTADTMAGTPGPGDNITCHGRRDCEWRHVIDAIHNSSYQTYFANTPTPGGGFVGKLIYGATSDKRAGYQEWQLITWWDAVDYIGIDAFFPLSAGDDPPGACIQDAWSGIGAHCGGFLSSQNQGDVFDLMAKLSAKFGRSIIFTGAGYESTGGSNKSPGRALINDTDPGEQDNDMQGLLKTFQSQPWWLGVIWSYDFAVWPRTNLSTIVEAGYGGAASPFDLDGYEADYATNTEWAGKTAGTNLLQYYQVKPIPSLAQIG